MPWLAIGNSKTLRAEKRKTSRAWGDGGGSRSFDRDLDLEKVALLVVLVVVSEPKEAKAALGPVTAEAGSAALGLYQGGIFLLRESGEGIGCQGLLLQWLVGGWGKREEAGGKAAGSCGRILCVARHGARGFCWGGGFWVEKLLEGDRGSGLLWIAARVC